MRLLLPGGGVAWMGEGAMELWSITGNSQKLDGGAMLLGPSMGLTPHDVRGRLRRPDSLQANPSAMRY
jgi:hypothetical protein